jgi:endonuclease/exonuclease/phosphatase (EEP) superfamily protein YafD
MGKLAVYKYFSLLFLIVTIIAAISTIIGLFGGNYIPAGNTAKAMLVYILPLLIIIDFILLLFWLLRRRWHWAAIPLVTLLCCIPYIGTLYQFRSLDETAEKKAGLKIATYNVARFNRETSGFIALDILAQMKKQKVDVLCIQEYNDISGDKKNSDSYKDYFPYMAMGKSDMVIFSRYPIVESKNIEFEETNNSAMWAVIDVNGQHIRCVNVHLQTTGINRTLHQAAKIQMQGGAVEGNRLLETIYGNYAMGMMIRAGQAITISNELRMNKEEGCPVVLCGDFNDVPYSFVYNTMLGDMVDGFKECGSGWMYTYRGKKSVRIDYIFHDEELKGLTYYRQDLSYSDHYPILMKFEL